MAECRLSNVLNSMQNSNSKNLTIREMTLEDLPVVYGLGETVFTADKWPSLYRTWDEYEPVRMFSNDGEFCFVADREGEVVGFALGSLIDKRKSAWCYGYLVWIAVSPALKRSGVATRLIDTLTEVFLRAGARMMIVDTDAENDSAINFFRTHGFGNEDRHVYMSKNLTTHPDYQRLRRQKD